MLKPGHAVLVFALFFAMLGASWGQSQQDVPQDQPAQPPTTDKRGTDQLPLTIKIQPAPQAKAEVEKEEQERREKAKVDEKVATETQRTADYTGWLALFTLLLFCTAILQAALFVWQLLYMRRSIKDAEDAARAAETAATAAKEQVEVAKAQIEVTKIGIFDLERAYLDAGPIGITTSFVTDPPPAMGYYLPGHPMEVIVKITITNTGRTRALISRAYGEFSQVNLAEQPIYSQKAGTNCPTDFSMRADQTVDFPYDFKTRHVGEQFFFGFVEYQDIFKKTHLSRFCVRIFPALENGKTGRFQLAGNEHWRGWD